MSEKRVYQEKMLNSKKEIVLCNWERGEGKTYSIFRKIMENKNGKYLYISNTNDQGIKLKEFFKEYYIKTGDIKSNKTTREEINYKYSNGDDLNIIFGDINSFGTTLREIKNVEYIFFDECYPNKGMLRLIKEMKIKRIFIMITNDDIEYIDSRQNIEEDFMRKCAKIASNKDAMNNFIDASIVKLINEFSLIPQTEKTTMTRNSILDMIGKLKELKK